jgi:hypothetical protein
VRGEFFDTVGYMKRTLIFVLFVIALGVVGYGVLQKQGKPPVAKETQSETPQLSFQELDFAKIDRSLRFSAKVPEGVEVGSDVFITTFQASEFLTLKTVTIHKREAIVVQGHEAVLYEIEKKPEAPSFSGQPGWRNERHVAIDIRFSKNNPTTFYSFAFRPGLEQQLIDAFLQSLVFHNDKTSIVPSLPSLQERVVKKPFGMYITPENSPVSPEFFTGYHTGVDYEIFPKEETASVPVFAMCGGELKVARRASGYGGVAVQECLFEDMPVMIVYGHLLESSLVQPGSYLSPGDVMGNLAPAGPEAGGGRKHLHIGIQKGSEADIRGYVGSKEELADWLDPR